MKRLVYRAGWIGERTFDMYGKFLDKVITQAGDVACYLITIVAAVIGTSIICDYCRRRGPDDGLGVLPWWKVTEDAAIREVAAAAPGAADNRIPERDPRALESRVDKVRVIPFVPSGGRLPPHLEARIEAYEKRGSNVASLVCGELPHPRVTSWSNEFYGQQRMSLKGLFRYTNDEDRNKLAFWLESDKGRCHWSGLAVRYCEDERGDWIRAGETPRPRSSTRLGRAETLPNVEVWKVTGPKGDSLPLDGIEDPTRK